MPGSLSVHGSPEDEGRLSRPLPTGPLRAPEKPAHSLKGTATSTPGGGPLRGLLKASFLFPFPFGVLCRPSPAAVFVNQSNGCTLRLQDGLRRSGL